MSILLVQHLDTLAVSVFGIVASGGILGGVAKYISANNFVMLTGFAIGLALAALLIYKWPGVA